MESPDNSDSLTLRGALATLTDALNERGEPNPGGHARRLLAETLDISDSEFFSAPERELEDADRSEFGELVERVRSGEPIAYIRGSIIFMGLEFEVDSRVLIPRPETAVLVRWALELLDRERKVSRVLDLGTGAGTIGVSVAEYHPEAEVVMTDVSEDALEVCRSNVHKHGLGEHCHCFHWDLFETPPEDLSGSFDMILSNPPYVTEANRRHLDESVREFEPRAALFGEDGEGGMRYFERIAELSNSLLDTGGSLLLEVAADQAFEVRDMLKHSDAAPDFRQIKSREDERGIERVVGGLDRAAG